METAEVVNQGSRQHPYQSRIPERWREVDRWFMLNTSLDPAGTWTLDTEIPVFSLARVMGEGDHRQWLLYAHSPVKARKNVVVEIPEFGNITVDVTPAGNFYHLKAIDRAVNAVTDIH